MKKLKDNELFYQQVKYMREVKGLKRIENISKKPVKPMVSPYKVVQSRSPLIKRTPLKNDIKNKMVFSKSP